MITEPAPAIARITAVSFALTSTSPTASTMLSTISAVAESVIVL